MEGAKSKPFLSAAACIITILTVLLPPICPAALAYQTLLRGEPIL